MITNRMIFDWVIILLAGLAGIYLSTQIPWSISRQVMYVCGLIATGMAGVFLLIYIFLRLTEPKNAC